MAGFSTVYVLRKASPVRAAGRSSLTAQPNAGRIGVGDGETLLQSTPSSWKYESSRQYGDPRITVRTPGAWAPRRAAPSGIPDDSPNGGPVFWFVSICPRGRFLETEAPRAVVPCRSPEASATLALGEGGSCGVPAARESSELQHSHRHETLRLRCHRRKRELLAERANRSARRFFPAAGCGAEAFALHRLPRALGIGRPGEPGVSAAGRTRRTRAGRVRGAGAAASRGSLRYHRETRAARLRWVRALRGHAGRQPRLACDAQDSPGHR